MNKLIPGVFQGPTNNTIAQLCALLTIVSASLSPFRSFASTTSGRSEFRRKRITPGEFDILKELYI